MDKVRSAKEFNIYSFKKQYKYIPNLITLTNMSIGLFVIYSIISDYSLEKTSICAMLILVAGILDFLDGRIARKFNVESSLGKQLDSLADLISFGVAPITLFINNYTKYMGIIWIFICILYTLTGALRLAKYNILPSSGHFIGIPITFSGMILSVKHIIAINFNLYQTYFNIDFILTSALTLFLAYMMISNMKVKKI